MKERQNFLIFLDYYVNQLINSCIKTEVFEKVLEMFEFNKTREEINENWHLV